jgi:expansin (peptidoglycan-binding protein)
MQRGIFYGFALFAVLLSISVLFRNSAPVSGDTAELFLPVIETAPPSNPNPVHSGEGTYYDADGRGNCSFAASPNNLMVAAINGVDYGVADYCGATIRVTGPAGSVDVRIVDKCPGCARGDIDLSREAFAKIAEMRLGRVKINWQVISPAIERPIIYHFKDGSNPWWTAVQIRDHRNPIAKFEYQLADGSFREVPRVDYNYFVENVSGRSPYPGMGKGPFVFRVTDIYGNVLTDANIPLGNNTSVSGTAQFPALP